MSNQTSKTTELKEGKNHFGIALGRNPWHMDVGLYVTNGHVKGEIETRIDNRKDVERLENLISTAVFKFGGEIDETFSSCDNHVVRFWLPLENAGKFVDKYGSSEVKQLCVA